MFQAPAAAMRDRVCAQRALEGSHRKGCSVSWAPLTGVHLFINYLGADTKGGCPFYDDVTFRWGHTPLNINLHTSVTKMPFFRQTDRLSWMLTVQHQRLVLQKQWMGHKSQYSGPDNYKWMCKTSAISPSAVNLLLSGPEAVPASNLWVMCTVLVSNTSVGRGNRFEHF